MSFVSSPRPSSERGRDERAGPPRAVRPPRGEQEGRGEQDLERDRPDRHRPHDHPRPEQHGERGGEAAQRRLATRRHGEGQPPQQRERDGEQEQVEHPQDAHLGPVVTGEEEGRDVEGVGRRRLDRLVAAAGQADPRGVARARARPRAVVDGERLAADEVRRPRQAPVLRERLDVVVVRALVDLGEDVQPSHGHRTQDEQRGQLEQDEGAQPPQAAQGAGAQAVRSCAISSNTET